MKIENRQKVLTDRGVSAVALLALDRLILTPLGTCGQSAPNGLWKLSKDLIRAAFAGSGEEDPGTDGQTGHNTLTVNLSMAEEQGLEVRGYLDAGQAESVSLPSSRQWQQKRG